jgi:Tfp pilus assembly protein PilF
MQPRRPGRASILALGLLVWWASCAATCGKKYTEKQINDSNLHLEMATTHLEEGRIVDARREAVLAIQSWPENADAHFTLGYVFGQMDEWGKAEEEARLALKYAKHFPEASNLLGVTLIEQGRYKEAIEILRGVAEDFLYATPHLAYGNLGLAYMKLEQYDEALENLNKAVELQPMFCLGYYRMGLVYYTQKRYKDALEKLDKAVRIEDPWKQCSRLQDAFRVMGLIHEDLDSQEEALESFRRCLEVDPSSSDGLECKRKVEEIEAVLGPGEESEEGGS